MSPLAITIVVQTKKIIIIFSLSVSCCFHSVKFDLELRKVKTDKRFTSITITIINISRVKQCMCSSSTYNDDSISCVVVVSSLSSSVSVSGGVISVKIG